MFTSKKLPAGIIAAAIVFGTIPLLGQAQTTPKPKPRAGTAMNPVIEQPVAPWRQHPESPTAASSTAATITQANAQAGSETPTTPQTPEVWPPPESFPLTNTARKAYERNRTPPTAPGNCQDVLQKDYARAPIGEHTLMIIDECSRDENRITFSGKILYNGLDRHLVVFHRFKITDEAGNEYRIEPGDYSKVGGLGKGYFYYWMDPATHVLAFRFVVSSKVIPDRSQSAMNISMPTNDDGNPATFSNLQQVLPTGIAEAQ